MSLQVWLPLNGNLENQGLSNVTVTNNGATVDNNGKIGKCYSFSNGNTLFCADTILSKNQNEYSISVWAKGYGCLYSQRPEMNSIYRCIFIYSQNLILFDEGNRWDASVTYDGNNWNHFVFIKNGSKRYIYINGHLAGENANASTPSQVSTGFFIGDSQITETSTSNNPFNGKLNDFRIYDHALSAKEVKELSKGLVLHYRLAGPGQANLLNGNIHLSSAWTQENHTVVDYSDSNFTGLKITATQANGRIYNSVSNLWIANNAKYTVSFWAKSDTVGTTIDCSRSLRDFSPTFTLDTNWKYYSGIITTTGTATDGTLSIRINQASRVVYIVNIKVENGAIATPFVPPSNSSIYSAMGYNNNIEYDCSGYRRNGTKSRNITWDIDSPRYTTSYSALSDYPIKAEVNMPSCDSMTVSFWTKITTFGTAKSGLFATSNMSTDPTDYNDTAMAQKDSDIDLKGVSGSGKIFNFTAPSTGQWHHCVFVYDGSKVYYYQDGKKINEEACAIGALKSYQYFYLGYSKAGGVVRKTLGKWSDLRIYTTALSAEDIAELYHSAVIVDNTGKSYAYEYFEAQ